MSLPETQLHASDTAVLLKSQQLAQPLLHGQALDTGEDAWQHACGVSDILASMGASDAMRAAAFLVYVAPFWSKPQELITHHFGAAYATMVTSTIKLIHIQRQARDLGIEGNLALDADGGAGHIERVRKMLLAFSQDLRVVLLRLASRLQTLRYFASHKIPCPHALAKESQLVFAPLANRLGIWQIKWELEDLSFRFLQPTDYHAIAHSLDEKRVHREAFVEHMIKQLQDQLHHAGVEAEVAGRPKHIFSIWKKMQGKHLNFDQVYDVRAFRIIVADIPGCYNALAALQASYESLPALFKDYVAKPKPNGYRSLHLVLRDTENRYMEVQIRTADMHEHAEFGVAAHWAYKEAGTKGYSGGFQASGEFEDRIAQARKSVLGQLLAWERDLAETDSVATQTSTPGGQRVYVFTPDARLIELPQGATAVDFAYAVHTELGHRCRGAKVDGQMVALTTPLQHGQTVEVVTAKEGGPSRDWLNAESGYLQSPRAKAKVRAWFNLQNQAETQAKGREAIEKLLQREGKTAIKLDQLAVGLGFNNADRLFEVVGKDELSLQHVSQFLQPSPAPSSAEDTTLSADGEWSPRKLGPAKRHSSGRSDILVVGIDSMLSTLAACCHPVPPDSIVGYVTRGQGVAVHRRNCKNVQGMALRAPERFIEVAWDTAQTPSPSNASKRSFAAQLQVHALDRPQLMRDVVDTLSRQRAHVTQVHTRRDRALQGGTMLHILVQVQDSAALADALKALQQCPGVQTARRM